VAAFFLHHPVHTFHYTEHKSARRTSGHTNTHTYCVCIQSRITTTVPSLLSHRTIVGQSCNSFFLPIVYPMARHFQRTTFKLNWTQFCVTDNDFCNSLLFSIKLFSFQFHVCIHMTDFSGFAREQHIKTAASMVLIDSIDYRTQSS